MVDSTGFSLCKKHKYERAAWRCTKCGSLLCPGCAASEKIQSQQFVRCIPCGGIALPIMTRRIVRPFRAVLPGFLRDFLAGPGLFQFFIFVTALYVFSWIPFCGAFLYSASLASYLLSIVREAAKGTEKLPGVPEMSDIYDDLFYPAIRFMVVSAMLWLPAAAYIFFHSGLRAFFSAPLESLKDPVLSMLVVMSMVLYPAMFMAAAIGQSLAAVLNPLILFRVILKLPGRYFLLAAVWTVLALLDLGIGIAVKSLSEAVPIPVISSLFTQAVVLIIPITTSFMFGRFVYQNSVSLGYMTDRDFTVPEYEGAVPRHIWPLAPPAQNAIVGQTQAAAESMPRSLTL